MPSILPNYEYDIYISYRQNDNKPATAGGRDGWVSNFVARLQELGIDPIQFETDHYIMLPATPLAVF
jgi:hypothetical protein